MEKKMVSQITIYDEKSNCIKIYYSILSTTLHNNQSYGIEVSSGYHNTDSGSTIATTCGPVCDTVSIPCISHSKADVLEMIQLLSDNEVTAVTVNDILCDFTVEKFQNFSAV